jgi:rubrerythrin
MDWDDWDDWDAVVDPLHPAHPFAFAEWLCPQCGEDGDVADLEEGRCPSCRSRVERL